MKKIIFICPYFGKLNDNIMSQWILSCRYNPTVDWLLITNDTSKYDLPDNINIIYTSFDEFRKDIKQKFNFEISLTNPYKLCDYRPTYGYIFNEYIYEYDYWGTCDISDCLYGDLRYFLTDEVIGENDKIFYLGHMTLYKNTERVNTAFNLETHMHKPLESILGTKNNMIFDELSGFSINQIFLENGFSILDLSQYYVDISPLYYSFRRVEYNEGFTNYRSFVVKKRPMIFEWVKGKLYEVSLIENKVEKREIIYVHFQKRKMVSRMGKKAEKFWITPAGIFSSDHDIDVQDLLHFSKERIIYKMFWKLKFERVWYHINVIFKPEERVR